MLSLFKLANVIDKRMTAISIEKNLCTKWISPKSSCQKCMDFCPMNCIAFQKDGIELGASCLECGLCTAVCPTGALTQQHPSLHQVVEEIIHTCEKHKYVYLHCSKMEIPEKDATTIRLPCLGAIPREAWVKIIGQCHNLMIYHNGSCGTCEFQKGEAVWKEELSAAESIMEKCLLLTPDVLYVEKKKEYDHGRRVFFKTLLKEIKTTNHLAIREVIGSSGVQSYRDRLESNTDEAIKKQWDQFSVKVTEMLTTKTSYPYYMQKRTLFLDELKKNNVLLEKKDIRLPVIHPDCGLCNACTMLCPTSALMMEHNDGKKAIKLEPYKCVDCRLCEEICYFGSIRLEKVENRTLMLSELVLIEES